MKTGRRCLAFLRMNYRLECLFFIALSVEELESQFITPLEMSEPSDIEQSRFSVLRSYNLFLFMEIMCLCPMK